MRSNDKGDFTFFKNLNAGKFKFLYLLGSDNIEIKKNNEFIVYQGSHGDRGAEIADVILPSAAYTEQYGLYENLEGRIQECKKASYPIGQAKEDWKIFNLIFERLGSKNDILRFDILRNECLSLVKNFTKINELPKFKFDKNKHDTLEFISEEIFIKKLDYYFSNSISRSSKTMSECRQVRQKFKKTGTNN